MIFGSVGSPYGSRLNRTPSSGTTRRGMPHSFEGPALVAVTRSQPRFRCDLAMMMLLSGEVEFVQRLTRNAMIAGTSSRVPRS